MRRVAGVDVGGTFTDLLLYEVGPEGERVRLAKILTTSANQADGVLAAIAEAGVSPRDLDLVIHGTTTTTNAVLERKVAKVGLVTTRGFRDTLELGRRTRPKPYGMTGTFEPLIPRERRIEIDERMNVAGEVVVPLDEAQLRARYRQAAGHGLREPGHPFPACLRQPRARAARRRDRAPALAQRLRHARARAAVRVPRVRARHHGVGQRGRAADPRPLRAAAAGRAGGPAASSATSSS